MAHQITFEGKTIDYDEKAVHSWSVQRMIAHGGASGFDAIDRILCGKADEVAALFDDDADKMVELVTAIGAISKDAKN